MNRETFLKTSAKLLGGGLLFGGYAWQVEPFWLEFVSRPMPVKNLPPEFDGKTLMQISDLHIGNAFSREYIRDSLRKAQAFKPDIVVYTGDFITYESPEQFQQLESVFSDLVLGKMATLGILGNHDYGYGWNQPKVADQIATLVRKKGVNLLRNEQFALSGLNFYGFDDYWGTNFNPNTLKGLDPSAANIVLCHNPDVCDLPLWFGHQDWILSGHTHGGQCRPPFLDPPLLPVQNKRYTSGHFDLGDGRQLYINRALGHLRQVRFNVRPEITLFTLGRG